MVLSFMSRLHCILLYYIHFQPRQAKAMSGSIALLFFAILNICVPSVRTQMAVASSSGICLGGCDISSSRIDEYQNRLKRNPNEPDNELAAKNRHDYAEYFVYSPRSSFEYCKNMQDEYVRCSSSTHKTSTIFEWYFFPGAWKGFIVATGLLCESPCAVRGTSQDVECLVDFDMFFGYHPCSIHFDYVKFTAESYLLSGSGLILGEYHNPHGHNQGPRFISLYKNRAGWASVRADIVHSDECNSKGCNVHPIFDGRHALLCTRKGLTEGTRLVSCYIKLTKMDPSEVEDNTCENWQDEHKAATKLLNQDYKDYSRIGPGSNNYCVEHGILVMADEIFISNIRLMTSNFTCNSQETVRYIVLMAKKTIFIDEDISTSGGVGRRFSSLVLLANLIRITTKITISVAGSHSMEGVGYWANGTNGGNFYAAALQWQDANLLTIDASGGDSGCKIQTNYSQKEKWTNLAGETYFSLQWEHPTAFKFEFTRDLSPQFNHTSNEFKVYGALEYEVASPGNYGTIIVHGIEGESPTQISNQGIQKPCSGRIPPKQNCIKINYHGSDASLGNSSWHAYPFGPFPLPTHASNESFFYPVRQWIVNLSDTWTDEEILKISTHIDEVQSILQFDSPTMFYEELKILILNSQSINNELEINLLHSLRRRITEYRGANDNEINFLNYVYAAALAHNRRVRGQDTLVTDLLQFLSDRESQVKEYVESWMLRKKLETINLHADTYTGEIESEIKKAMDLIKTQVTPRIEEIRQDLSGELEKVKAQIKEFLQQAREHLEALNANLQKAVAATVLNSIFNAVKVVGGVFAIFGGPTGAVVGAILGGVGEIGKSITNAASKRNKLKPITQIPDGTWSGVMPTSDWIDKKQARLITNMENIIAMYMSDPEISDFIELVQTNLEELRAADPYSKTRKITKREQYSKVEEVESTISKAIMALESAKTRSVDHSTFKRQDMPNMPDKSTGITATFTAGSDFIKDVSGGVEEINNIKSEIAETEATVRNLIKFSQDFHKIIMPMVLGLMDTFDLVTKELNQTSLAAVDLASWNIQSSISNMAKKLSEVLSIFQASRDIQNSMQELQDAVGMIATIYKRIAAAKDQIKFADMFSEISILSITDPSLLALSKHMSQSMVEAVIFMEVDRAISAFRQWTFPVAKDYLDIIHPPPFMIESPDSTSFNDTAVRILTQMKQIVQAENFEITLRRKLSTRLEFYTDESTASYPFFTWEYSNHSSLIIQLLEAKTPVTFFADVNLETSIHYEKDAVKFEKINFEFRVLNNKAKETKLKDELARCRLEATHMGYSYYKYDGKTYLFRNKPLTFQNSTKEIDETNTAYEKGTPVLSPYGFWQFQIKPKLSHLMIDLQPSPEDIINLDLVGTGIYYRKPTDSNDDLEVDKYYKENEFP